MKKLKLKKSAVRLLMRHLRQSEKGTTLFKASTESLNKALALGVPTDEPIELRDGRKVVLRDQFSGKNEAFAAKIFHRFKLEDWKEPKAPKTEESRKKAQEVQKGEAPEVVA